MAIRIPGGGHQESEIAVVLDDSDDVLGDSSVDAWREWLLWSNLLQLRTRAAAISSRRHLASASMTIGVDDTTAETAAATGLDPAWQAVFDEVTDVAKSFVLALAAAGVPVPVVGEEVNGLPIEISWPKQHIASNFDLNDRDRQELRDAGWTIVLPDAEIAAAALDAVTNGSS